MKLFIFTVFSFAILTTLSISLFVLAKSPTATIKNHTFILDVAKTAKQQEIGLAKYTSLPMNKAMYFPFDRDGYYSFWMKNMHFAIDIIYIRNSKIITIFSSVPAPTKNQIFLPIYQPVSPANAVLEINAGLAKKYGFTIGDKIYLHV